MKCPKCKRYIASNLPWICGFRGCRNDDADHFPFVHRCEHCNAEPKAYICHYSDCGKPIFLTRDELVQNAACCTKPFKVRSDLDIAGLKDDLKKGELELEIQTLDNLRRAKLELEVARVRKEIERLAGKPDLDEQIAKERADTLMEMAYETQKSRMSGLKEQAAAAERQAQEANLPLAERLRRKHDREFAAADACRAGRERAEELFQNNLQRLEQERRWWKNQEDDLSI